MLSIIAPVLSCQPIPCIVVHANSLKFVSSPYSTKGWSKVKQQRRLVWTCLILWDPTCNSIGVNLAQYQEGQSAKKVRHLVKKWDMLDQNVYILKFLFYFMETGLCNSKGHKKIATYIRD